MSISFASGTLYKTKQMLSVYNVNAIQKDNSILVQDIIDLPNNEFLFCTKDDKDKPNFLYKNIIVTLLYKADIRNIDDYLGYIQ